MGRPTTIRVPSYYVRDYDGPRWFGGSVGRALIESQISGDRAVPYEVLRARVCERMHWTFMEFDQTPINAVFELLEIWRIEKELNDD